MDAMDTLLRAAQVARLLSISRAKAYQLMASGEIRTVRIGSSVRVDPRDLAEFMERMKS
jgi:excisionase family DNA binding protein